MTARSYLSLLTIRTVDVPADRKVKSYARCMRIGELGKAAGLPAKTIRFYESAGLLPEPDRTTSGYRDYDHTALARLAFIRSAQTAGLTLAEIRQVIAVREGSGPPCQHVIGLLDEHAHDLDQRIAGLTALRADVQRLRERARTLDPADCAAEAVCHVLPSASASPSALASPVASVEDRGSWSRR